MKRDDPRTEHKYTMVSTLDEIPALVGLIRIAPNAKALSANIMADLKRVSEIVGTRITQRREK